MVLTSLERREILRVAVLAWITPFFAALSMVDLAAFNLLKAAEYSFWPTAALTSLVTFFTLVFRLLLRRRLVSF